MKHNIKKCAVEGDFQTLHRLLMMEVKGRDAELLKSSGFVQIEECSPWPSSGKVTSVRTQKSFKSSLMVIVISYQLRGKQPLKHLCLWHFHT